jgi:hypothetical protein
MRLQRESMKNVYCISLKNILNKDLRLTKFMYHFSSRIVAVLLTFIVGISLTFNLLTNRPSPQIAIETRSKSCDDPLDCAVLVARTISGGSSYTMSEIAVKYAEIGQFDKATQLINTIDDEPDKVAGTAKIATKFWNSGHRDKALELFASLKLIARDEGNPFLNIEHTY